MVLSIEALTSTYPGHVAVADVNATIEPGEAVAIVGPKSCGKSTLQRSIARLHRPVAGQVLMDGDDIWRLHLRQVTRRLSQAGGRPGADPAALRRGGRGAYLPARGAAGGGAGRPQRRPAGCGHGTGTEGALTLSRR